MLCCLRDVVGPISEHCWSFDRALEDYEILDVVSGAL